MVQDKETKTHVKNFNISPELNDLILKTSKKLSIPSTSVIRFAVLNYCRRELGMSDEDSFYKSDKQIENTIARILKKYQIEGGKNEENKTPI